MRGPHAVIFPKVLKQAVDRTWQDRRSPQWRPKADLLAKFRAQPLLAFVVSPLCRATQHQEA